MNRPLRILSLLVIVLVLLRGTEYIVEQALNRELPALLTDVLGIPVRIAPLRADIISLTAKTARFEMGEPDRLAIDASDVWVSLDWSDLLSGEIRLVSGAGRELMLDISAWPRSDGPPKQDYANLEQWLPSTLDVTDVRYRREDGSELHFYNARWRRAGGRHADADNASLGWQSRFPTGNVDIDIDLASLDDLLWLRDFQAAITLAVDNDELPVSELGLSVKPAEEAVYQLALDGELAGMPVELRASGIEAWALPNVSRTRAEFVNAGDLGALLNLLVADGKEDAYQGELSQTVPVIKLPRHDAELDIGELYFGKEKLHDVGFSLTTSGSYLAFTRIAASGPYADLVASAAVATVEDGWEVALGGDMVAHSPDQGIMARYVDSQWLAKRGRTRLKTHGNNWAQLLDELEGTMDLAGVHRGGVETPVSMHAEVDGSPDRFALENVALQLGDSQVNGEVAFSSVGELFLRVRAEGSRLDLRFLATEDSAMQEPGVTVPTFLSWLPQYHVEADLNFDALVLPALTLGNPKAQLDRGTEAGSFLLSSTGPSAGKLEIGVDYQVLDSGAADTTLTFRLDRVYVSEFFGLGSGALGSRTSGLLTLKAQGNSVREVLRRGRGEAKLQLETRDDGDWSRDPTEGEVVRFNGAPSLAVEDSTVVGIVLEDIDIDALRQDVTGTFSIVVTREPAMVADLVSERLNIDRIMDFIPDSADAADESDTLTILRDALPGRITLAVEDLIWLDREFQQVEVALSSRPLYFGMDKLSFRHRGSRVDGGLSLNWQDQQTATFNSDVRIEQLRLLEFFGLEEQRLRDNLSAPLQGELKLVSVGDSLAALATGLSGQLLLETTNPDEPSPDRLDITFEQLADGGQINFRELKLAGSDVRGGLRVSNGTPRRYQLELDGGTLDLTPWELAEPADTETSDKDTGGPARQTAQVARNLVGFAGSLFGGGERTTEPGERIFSSEPFDLAPVYDNDIRLLGKLGRIYSGPVVAEDFEVDAQMANGRISVDLSAAQANGGPASGSFRFDANVTPPVMALEVMGERVHRRPQGESYPTSLHAVLNSTGVSEAEFAANMNGQTYLELGRGPMDYRGVNFLTADMASNVFSALIPGAKDRVPEVRCGATLLEFKDGIGVTPYGYAVQTRSANLLGGMELDLVDEQMRVRFQSRSRKGVGISIGNAFSSTVELSGPLNDPSIVPNTPGLLVRGWAAFMTAGLSVLGESVVNRMLASEDPCGSLQEEMRKKVCGSNQPLATSPLACPTVVADAALP